MAKKTFEGAMKRLDEIVSKLESGELSLDDSLKLYEEGVELTHFCTAKLNETEKKIKMLVKKDGEFELQSTEI
ncbi:MAG: exodeoxyribonuclease VII small subunit [bacterium]